MRGGKIVWFATTENANRVIPKSTRIMNPQCETAVKKVKKSSKEIIV
jgi:hypothetical protein